MIRIDLGSDDKRSKAKGLAFLKGFAGNLKLPGAAGGAGAGIGGGKSDEIKAGFKRLKKMIGNLGSLAIVLIAAGLAVVPHIAFLQYRLFVVKEHEARKTELQQKIAAIEKEIGKLKPYQKELASYEAQKTLVKERLDVIRTLLAQRGTPVNVLDAIGQALPARVWLRAIEFDIKSPKPQVTITGSSLSNEDIADYAEKLAESVHLQDVNLEKVESGRQGGLDAKAFVLNIVPKGMRSVAKQEKNVPAKVDAKAPPPKKSAGEVAADALKNGAERKAKALE